MIRAFPRQPSPRAGSVLRLHVETDAPRFRAEFYRYGSAMSLQNRSGWLPGAAAPPHLPYQDWGESGRGPRGDTLAGWRAYDFSLPPDWPPGVYVVVLVEGDGHGRELSCPDRSTPDGRDGRALFVLRRAAGQRPAPILYKLPLLTYHAYNTVDGAAYDPETGRGSWCLYNAPTGGDLPPAVGLHRPGGGTGGAPWDSFNFDPFDPTPRQTFVHWDARFIAWLEQGGYAVDYCTDVDLHREGGDLLHAHRVLVSAGHDEYWSDAMRAAVEAYVDAGGNVAFFGGNTCWWRVVFDDEHTFHRAHQWSDTAAGHRPENTLTGVSFRNGGERDRDDHPTPVGYRVQHADHWAYAGTGLREGATFGDAPRDYLVGYECDGALFDRADLAAGRPVRATGEDGTPAEFTILAVGDTAPSGWGLGNRAATLGVYERGGTVFNAATTDWARVLGSATCPAVERITRNVLDRLSAGPTRG